MMMEEEEIMNKDRLCYLIALVLVPILSLGINGAKADTAKKNLAYYIDAPASTTTPIMGKITATRMQDLADSELTHIVFGFVEFFFCGRVKPDLQLRR